MDKIIIIGSSGHAKVVIDTVQKEGKYQVAGLIDQFRPAGEQQLGYKILGKEEDLPELIIKYDIKGGLIAIGDNWVRKKVYEKVNSILPGFRFFTAIHPSAQLAAGVKTGNGTVILAGAIVNTDAKIGEFCILNTKVSLDHDSLMEDFSSLAPGVTVGGNVRIGKYTAISLGANILHKLEIGDHTVIGAGALVTRNVAGHKVAYGVPAREIRERAIGEPYL